MMNDEDKAWTEIARGLGAKHGFAPLSPEQAQEELESLPDVKLTSGEVESIMDAVTSGQYTVWQAPVPPAPQEPEVGIEDEIAEDVLQLNRNEGEADADTDELLDQLRQQALDGEDNDGEADTPGLGGDAEPPTKGD